MKLSTACRRTTFAAVTGGIAAVAILASGTATAAVPASAAAAITSSTTLFTPDGKHAAVTLAEIPVGGEYDDAVSFSQVSAGVTDEVLADHSALETTTGAVTLYLTGVRIVQAAICDSSGCSMWWPSSGAPTSPGGDRQGA